MPTDLSSIVVETLEAPLPVGTVLSSIVVETLEAPLPAGTVLSSVVVETLEAPLPVGTALSSIVVETLEAPLPVGTVLSSVYAETLEQPLLPIAVVPDISGTVGSPATFDGSGSIRVDNYLWTITSVPGGSSITVPTPFPDGGAATPIDMTDNEGLWHFEGNANDTSGNARNGTVTGAALVTGKIGSQAYQFGVSDYIDFGAASTFLAAPDDFSISIWIKGDAGWTPALYDSVLGFSNAFTWNQGVGLYFTNANTLRFFVGAYNGFFTEGTLGTVSNWNHVAITYISGTLRLYINGVEASNNTGGSTLTGLTDQLQVGRLGTYGNLEATLDEFAIWSRGLSPTEIADIYALQAANGSTLTFTPDVAGTYSVQLEVSGDVYGLAVTDTATADAVISTPSSGLVGFIGEDSRPLIGLFATRPKRDS